MWLADTSVKRPVFATMVIMALVVLGIVSYPSIGVDLFPKIDFPIVTITTTLKGASPDVMDVDVADRIEGAVNTINGVKTITSTSTESVSRTIVEFVLERDIDLAVQDVREKVSEIRNKLPEDIEEPRIAKVDPDSTPILFMNLSGNKSIRDLSTYADEVLKEQLQRINGVGNVNFYGLRLRQVRIWLDAAKMQAYQIAPSDVVLALKRENIELPGGRIETDTKEYTVRIKGEFPQIPDFNDLIVSYYNGAPVKIKDIGRAEDGTEERRSLARFNGIPAVGMGIQKQSGTNTVAVADRVKKEVEKINKTLPPGMKLNISVDQSVFIVRSINEVQHHLILGSLFAILAVFLFLKNIRTTLISAVALPVSIISTFAIINAFNFTFNNMTMLALSLSVGLLIDDAIIVIENIYRHVEEGMAPMEAAKFATSEIGLAVMATTLAIVAIFLPVAFMKGIIGRFFLQFALTIVFAVMVSLLVSFTLTPMMASIFLKPHTMRHAGAATNAARVSFFKKAGDFLEKHYKRLETFYRRVLEFSLQYRKTMLVAALLIFVLSILLAVFGLGKEFLPPEDQGNFIVRMEAPIDYSVDQVERYFGETEKMIKEIPGVKSVFYVQGIQSETNKGRIMVTLLPKAERTNSQEDIKKIARMKLKRIPGMKASAEDISLVGGGIRQVPIQYSIRGQDLAELQKYAKQISAEFAKLPGIVDVDTSLEVGKPEFKVYIDRDKAADLGVDVATVAEAINLLIGGELDIARYKDEKKGKRYDVRVRLNREDRASSDALQRIYVRARDGKLVELGNVVKLQEGTGPSVINRADRQRAITIFASLEGKPLGEAQNELNAIAARILPADYVPKYYGMAEVMQESFVYLLFALMLGIVMAYMILASQFESFIHPVTILLSMPMSFIGAFGALFVTGKTLNIFSLIGLILLMGLVKKNAILLVDYTNVLRERGMSRREAILQAGPVRMRPILMTTFAMIFGMLPIAFAVGEGAETRAPMGIAVIGGLLTSLILTLVVVPAAYDIFDDWQEYFKKRRAKKAG
ncbi:MAG TPA: efflux RND transporter permease subunit [Smithella sp.]|nr:efflux RND transporter permease subunit [Smithella sp.]HOG89377.1 efflux RND transporter permease subunit [Smithella sp.]HOU51716.1 efflux RND transporter permease subunit [Smithella sp.]HQG64425.1 efflux RND transporter permease subunit [Smithella sp.]HQH17113.1 efflux RND transporter permease subunit [Smithella sp.]